MSEVKYEKSDGVAVLTLMRGGANALSPGMRQDLSAALARAADDPEVRAVVLTGAGGVFCSGVDLAEYDGTLAAPWVNALTRQIEDHPKPVVAALEGAALGAGFELALAAHARLAKQDCRVALPEATLGLMPSGGSTQRLPRLLGAQASLEFLLSGRSIVAGDPKLARVFTRVTEGAPLEDAKAEALRLAARGDVPRVRDVVRGFSDPVAYQKAVSAVAGQVRDEASADSDILRCVEAAQLLPYEQGLNFEASAFEARMARPDARAARHLYTAERRASIWPEAQEGRARKVQTVVLVGADVMLAELAVYCLDREQRVAILANGPGAEAVAARARAVYDGAVARGRMTEKQRDARVARLSFGSDASVLLAADLVIERGGVDVAGQPVKAGAVWCLAAGQHRIRARQAELGVEVDVLGLRAYRPAHTRPLVELAVPDGAAADAVMTAVQVFTGPGRSVLRSADRAGMIGHRLMGAMQSAALALLRAGAAPAEIEAGARRLGFAKGPLEITELEGSGLVAARLRRMFGERDGLDLLEARAGAVAEGVTPGQGFYAPQGQALVPDAGLEGWLADWRAGQSGLPEMPKLDMDRALHAALVAEAVRMIEDGTLARASDADLCMVKGYGFDRSRGGPMLWADIEGCLALVRAMKALQPVSAPIWTPPAMIEDMVKYGRGFFGG